MRAAFPHEYKSQLVWEKDREGILSSSIQPSIKGGPPPQFDGNPEHWSPEELLLSAVQLCLMTTFMALVAKDQKVGLIHSYKSEINGKLDKTKDGIIFTHIQIGVDLKAENEKLAWDLLLTAKKYCIISNTLNVPVEVIKKEEK